MIRGGMVKKPSVLVIDDDTFILSVIESSLKRVGYPVRIARSGTEAFEEMGKRLPDLIILDKIMPDMHGDEVLLKIKENKKTASIPVVMMTADKSMDGVSKSLKLGACDYIVKPVTSDTLLLKISRLSKLMPS